MTTQKATQTYHITEINTGASVTMTRDEIRFFFSDERFDQLDRIADFLTLAADEIRNPIDWISKALLGIETNSPELAKTDPYVIEKLTELQTKADILEDDLRDLAEEIEEIVHQG